MSPKIKAVAVKSKAPKSATTAKPDEGTLVPGSAAPDVDTSDLSMPGRSISARLREKDKD